MQIWEGIAAFFRALGFGRRESSEVISVAWERLNIGMERRVTALEKALEEREADFKALTTENIQIRAMLAECEKDRDEQAGKIETLVAQVKALERNAGHC